MKRKISISKPLLRSCTLGMLLSTVALPQLVNAQTYCSPSYSTFKPITNTTFAGINNSNEGWLSQYQNFTTITATAQLGQNLPISISGANGGLDILVDAQYISVFIDYNGNGIFENSERTNIGYLSAFLGLGVGTVTGTISIPSGITTGAKRMRVVSNSGTYSNNGCGGADIFGQAEDYTVNIIAPVPIVLSSFTASINTQSHAQLEWVTSSEKNNKGFKIQRSVDGKSFETIGFYEAQTDGNSDFDLKYTFVDEQTPQGKVFYRLNQLDFDGTTSLSDVLTITSKILNPNSFTASVYPNPAQKVINIQTSGLTNGNVVATITDMSGRAIKSVSMSEANQNIDISQLNTGIYYIVVKDAHQSKTIKLMKQ